MAYLNGQVSSYSELRDVLVAACQNQGWTWSNGILSKSTMQVKLFVESVGSYVQGPGLIAQGIKNGIESTKMRIGPATSTGNILPVPIFPFAYHLFVFTNPDEIFLIVKYDIDRFMFLAFGMSTILSESMWLTASLGGRYVSTNAGISIKESAGGGNSASNNVKSGGPFWSDGSMSSQTDRETSTQDTYLAGLEGVQWSSSYNFYNNVQAVRLIQPLISRQPSAFSSEAIFLPIQIAVPRASNKTSIVADIKNARYLRIDNYEPGQILTLGNDKWMVFPFHRKNITARNGGDYIDHTGTFGWVIRYEGP